MNKRLLISLTLTSATLAMPLAFADSTQSCDQYYQKDKPAFLQTLQGGDASAIHNSIQNCVQNNACANATDPDTCLKRIHIYDYYATVAAKQQAQNKSLSDSSFGANNSNSTNTQDQQTEQKPRSSYNFTYKPPIPNAQDNNTVNSYSSPVPVNGQTHTAQQNIYKHINF